ncbi:hypothetical protein [Bradyrhizobium japonicum]|jgi:hypothetical protein|uniref:Uncharacterized protein n=1 Tax=Bradyrhizobium japonicum TaxID=375 RepID=A0ABV2RL45_BRAJP|nr:hypothetical protein [Bradyrhizobium japonicum]MCP1762373.1 hypothetical protein [Bradyrhizobium japonicum]MCP1793953.1 hypothetical protein [Bradyrhizobium japonicum]MCP1806386.1 hypothetical protein [Bradyrhizobium japonicum]MCP1815314.1 hypothetical protein [Bradyrhizobium japonicum]MCP1873169.1 hypothetical protein [Bradyrhizobium japonicum]
MKKSLLAAAAMFAFPAISHASYTECTMPKETELANRPGGQTEPRWLPIEKDQKVAIRDTFRDWVFVVHFDKDSGESVYGWVQRNDLASCRAKDGTP